MERIYYLYKITNIINNKVYIGQTVRPRERWSQHKTYAGEKKAVQYIHHVMNKYGAANFTFEVIASSWTQGGADEAEKLLISQYDSRNSKKGYNISPGGDPAWNRGLPTEQQPMYGKKQSEYFKKRMSEVHTGKLAPHSQEWKDNMSRVMSGRIFTEEWKKKISIANSGRTISDDWKDKISTSHMGKTVTEETKSKISRSNKGKAGPRGEKCGHAKLTWVLVREIRQEFATGNYSKRVLAKKYGVSYSTIEDIVKNITWKEE
jgi:group I intron endonuclease